MLPLTRIDEPSARALGGRVVPGGGERAVREACARRLHDDQHERRAALVLARPVVRRGPPAPRA